jgi:gas vesicle protein
VGLIVAKKQKKRSGSGFFMGLVIGVAIGAAAVWVLTPQPGELETKRTTRVPASGAMGSAAGAADASAAYSADGATTSASPTIVDLAMAVVDRVRGRFDEAVALGREAYAQGQTEVMQRFNQARSAE